MRWNLLWPINLNANPFLPVATRALRIGALLASLIETSKPNGVNAEHWLSDVLAKLVNGWPAARPWASTYTMHRQDPSLAA
jgi:transposase